MSTEAMREGFNAELLQRGIKKDGPYAKAMWKGWQAAIANQEALIRAVIEECAEKCAEYVYAEDCPEAIRRINPATILEKMKSKDQEPD